MGEPSSIVQRLVIVTGPHDKPTNTALQMHEWTPQERTSRVWKRLAKWWGAAFVALIVPPHIPWFTIAFLGGPIAAWLASRQKATVQAQSVACPECGTTAAIEEQSESWPLGVRCEPCRHVFWINPVSAEQRSA